MIPQLSITQTHHIKFHFSALNALDPLSLMSRFGMLKNFVENDRPRGATTTARPDLKRE